MVASVSVQNSDAVAPNQAILTVVNLDALELEIALPEEYGNETPIGTPAKIYFNGREYDGRVTAIEEGKISLTEIVTDGMGGFIERPAAIALSE
jgi:Tfp pilus assembly protein PilP